MPHAPGKNATNQSIQIRTYHFQKALLVNLRPLKLEGLEGYTYHRNFEVPAVENIELNARSMFT